MKPHPAVFKPSKFARMIPAYAAHAGQTVTVLKGLSPGEFQIRGKDGWIGIAYREELVAK